jgi:ribosomal protein S3
MNEKKINANLDAKIMCERLLFALKRGRNYRRAALNSIKTIMNSKAHGVEIVIEKNVKENEIRRYCARSGSLQTQSSGDKKKQEQYLSSYSLSEGVYTIKIIIDRREEMPINSKEKKIEEHEFLESI